MDEPPDINSISLIIGSENLYWVLFLDQAHFASWHQCFRHICQSTKHMQQNSENTYKQYVKLLLDLIGVYLAFWFNILYENKYLFTNNSKKTGLKQYRREKFSPIVAG